MSVSVTHESLVTCPACGSSRLEQMPAFSCLLAYTCPACGALLRPADEDCCIFCTYGSVPCPPIQVRRQGGSSGACGA
jgi:hypothetical protein